MIIANNEGDESRIKRMGLKLNVGLSVEGRSSVKEILKWRSSRIKAVEDTFNIDLSDEKYRTWIEKVHPDVVERLRDVSAITTRAIDAIVKVEIPQVSGCMSVVDFESGEVWVVPLTYSISILENFMEQIVEKKKTKQHIFVSPVANTVQ